jgi:hypothetical protein
VLTELLTNRIGRASADWEKEKPRRDAGVKRIGPKRLNRGGSGEVILELDVTASRRRDRYARATDPRELVRARAGKNA